MNFQLVCENAISHLLAGWPAALNTGGGKPEKIHQHFHSGKSCYCLPNGKRETAMNFGSKKKSIATQEVYQIRKRA